jgi:uncharacterized protein YegL
MTKPNSAEIVIVLDRSGSMQSIRTDMIGGFQTFIEAQKKLPGDCKVTLTQFNNQYEVVYTAKPIAEVPLLDLLPSGGTALLDAIGRTVTDVGKRLALTPEAERPARVFVVIITDGQENASNEWNLLGIQNLLAQQQSVYNWEFIFLGADKNAISVAGSMGLRNAAQYQKNAGGIHAWAGSASASIGSSRLGGGAVVYDQHVYNAHLPTPQK